MKISTRSIGFRVAVVAASAAISAALAAAAIVWSFSLAEQQIDAALAAQRRIDLWSVVSGQISDYTFSALESARSGGGTVRRLEAAREAVRTAFGEIDKAVTESIETAPTDASKAAAANRGRLLARLRAGFEVLDRQIGDRIAAPSAEAADQIRGALNSFAVTFAPTLSSVMDDDRRTASRIRDEIGVLRDRLTTAAVFAVVLALLLAAWLYRVVARPIVTRVGEMGDLAAAIGRGELRTRLAVRGRDELSLAMAGFNRMAARLERREARVAADRARLEAIVAERTADLRLANERLAAVDAARQRFFTDVSHELRTPLTVILGECDLSLRKTEREGSAIPEEAIRTIRTRAQRLHRRVEDLLRIARSSSGEIDLHRAPVPVAAFVSEAIEDTATLMRRSGLTLEAEVPDDLAALADRDWMRQIVEGLLANAARHTPHGGMVRIVAGAEDGAAFVKIVDTGTGIPAEDLPLVFERFYRGRNASAGAGFGIGLALAKWVVERQDGTISIESEAAETGGRPRGTAVTIRLPAA